MRKVKIIGTLGPSSSTPEVIRKLIDSGLNVVRLNFSHGSHEDHRKVLSIVREQAEQAGKIIGVLADLCGPKIRVGKFENGSVELENGRDFTITTRDVLGKEGIVSTSYGQLCSDVKAGTRILLDDGLLELEVRKVEKEDVQCRVIVGGVLKNRKGMNIPNTPLSTPALTEKDKKDLAFARELGVDYLALSFVRCAADVLEAKDLAGEIPVIAKIEKPEAITDISEIIDAADGLMVARGDLGVEAGAEKVPLVQKRLIKAAARRGLPVIVATQMLDSMIENPRPTRAEVSDVANAVLDGTDAVMLSGETAAGEYPVEAVKKMASIIEEIERSEFFDRIPEPVMVDEYSFSNAIARAAVTVAKDLKLKALAVYSETGHSGYLTSAVRPDAQIVVFSRNQKVLSRMTLHWGVFPLYADWVEGVSGVVEQAEDKLLEHGVVQPGDDIAVTFGMQDMSGPGRTDVLKLWRIKNR